MINETITELEARIAKTDAIKPESKSELLDLLATLRSEIQTFAQTHSEDAETIAGFASISAQQAIRSKRNPELMELSTQGLSSSVSEFEESHPRLVQVVNRICETLANLGI